jgi:glutamate racemase
MNMRIVITDSGLGGLSVAAELERRLLENPIYKKVELIYFNSLYSSTYGYNSMRDLSEQAKVFNKALNSICEKYNPDLVLIACNTLSIIYPHTQFAKTTKIEVKGIVDSGVALYKDSLKNINEKIILMGTPITINSNVYNNALIKHGIDETQVINQPCLELETSIQNNPSSDETRDAIKGFVSQAARKVDSPSDKIFVGFCCTHYGYSEKIFNNEFSKQLNNKIVILNPNNKMLDFLFANSNETHANCELSVKVVSQVKFPKNEINSLTSIINLASPKTARALETYEFIENLFNKEIEE